MSVESGSRPAPSVLGTPTAAVDLYVRITVAGALGTAWMQSSADGGATWAAAVKTLPLSVTDHGITVDLGVIGRENPVTGGLRIRYQAGQTYHVGDEWSWTLATEDVAGTPTATGTGTDFNLADGADGEAQLTFEALLAGGGCPLPDESTEFHAAVEAQRTAFADRATAAYATTTRRCTHWAAVLGPM
jgi:hypothetical protein